MKYTTRLEKFLTLILRHSPETVNITLDSAGWVDAYELVQAIRTKPGYADFSMSTLQNIVNRSEKKRFEWKSNSHHGFIRARQGHSISVNLGYEPKTPPDVLYHGSDQSAVSNILQQGILPMNRHDVHLSQDRDLAERFANQRKRSPVIFEINSADMHREGHVFYHTDNDVWLVKRVPAKYIRRSIIVEK